MCENFILYGENDINIFDVDTKVEESDVVMKDPSLVEN